MSERLPRVTGAELIRSLERGGWRIERQTGSHAILKNPSKPGRRVIVARHAGRIVPPGTLTSILGQAGMRAEDLQNLL